MSSIVGSLGYGSGIVRDPVARGLAASAARGPDGGRRVDLVVGDMPLALGVRLLTLRDPGGRPQPVTRPSGAALVFDGELHNADALRARVAEHGAEGPLTHDAQLFCAILEHEGVEGLRHVEGAYAFAFLQGPEGPLLLGRDPQGGRTLFHATLQQGFLFASTLEALVAMTGRRPAARVDAVSALLRDGRSHGRLTAVQGVQRLAPGEVLSVDVSLGTISLQVPEPEPDPGDADLLDVLRTAVWERMRCDRPGGLLLSGGMDSGLIAALAQEVGKPDAFSLTFPGHRTADESLRARRMAQQLGLRQVLVPCPPDPTPWVLGAARAFDEPCADPSAVALWGLARTAGRTVRMVLTGLGGDSVLGGHRRFWMMGAGPWLRHLPGFIHDPVRGVLARRDHAGMRRAIRAAGDPSFRGLFRLQPPRVVRTVLGPLLRQAGRVGPRFQQPASALQVLDVAPAISSQELVHQERAVAAHGVEARNPFLDGRVRAAVRAIEGRDAENRARQKQLLRAFVQTFVDPDLTRVARRGFALPVNELYRGPLRPLAQDALLAKRTRERGFVSPAGARRLLSHHVAGQRNHGGLIHALVMLELWARRVLDGES